VANNRRKIVASIIKRVIERGSSNWFRRDGGPRAPRGMAETIAAHWRIKFSKIVDKQKPSTKQTPISYEKFGVFSYSLIWPIEGPPLKPKGPGKSTFRLPGTSPACPCSSRDIDWRRRVSVWSGHAALYRPAAFVGHHRPVNHEPDPDIRRPSARFFTGAKQPREFEADHEGRPDPRIVGFCACRTNPVVFVVAGWLVLAEPMVWRLAPKVRLADYTKDEDGLTLTPASSVGAGFSTKSLPIFSGRLAERGGPAATAAIGGSDRRPVARSDACQRCGEDNGMESPRRLPIEEDARGDDHQRKVSMVDGRMPNFVSGGDC